MFKIILNIAKYITAIGVIGGAALWLDARFDAQTERGEELIEMVEYNSIHLSQMDQSIQGIQDTLNDFEKEHKEQGKQIESLLWGLKNIERFTPGDFEDIMDELLKKNEEPILSPTVWSGAGLTDSIHYGAR